MTSMRIKLIATVLLMLASVGTAQTPFAQMSGSLSSILWELGIEPETANRGFQKRNGTISSCSTISFFGCRTGACTTLNQRIQKGKFMKTRA